jgi:hypothetical protein
MLKYSVLASLCFLFAGGRGSTAYVQRYQSSRNLDVFARAGDGSEVCASDGSSSDDGGRLYDAFSDQFRTENIDIRDVIRDGARHGEDDIKLGSSDGDGLDSKRRRLTRLKDWRDSFRPLSGDIVATMKTSTTSTTPIIPTQSRATP